MISKTHTYCGYVAVMGRPNVGKSTLLNRLIAKKISITSRKPQTTRQSILGIRSDDTHQLLYLDTPGLHHNAPKALNKHMNRAATGVLLDADLVLFLVDRTVWTADDAWTLKKLDTITKPVILIINKQDRCKQKARLATHMQVLAQKRHFAGMMAISAKSPQDVMQLEKKIKTYIPSSPFLYPRDQKTDKSIPFLMAEIIREKLMRQLGEELPYALSVTIEHYTMQDRGPKGRLATVFAAIYVARKSQKRIVIGSRGACLKRAGQAARYDIEKLIGCNVFLKLWVKVKAGWMDSTDFLEQVGETCS